MSNLDFIATKPITGLVTAIALVISLIASVSAMASGVPDVQYKLQKSEYKVAEIRYPLFSCGAKDICEKSSKVVKNKRIENSNAPMQMTLPKMKLLANKKPVYSNSMKVIEEISSPDKKSRLM
jgi:hypothetical protein